MTRLEMLAHVKAWYSFLFGANYPDPPRATFHNRAGRRDYARQSRAYWRKLRKDCDALDSWIDAVKGGAP